MDFLFDTLPNKLVPFDYETFANSPMIFKVCVTESETGQSVYFEKSQFNGIDFTNKVLRVLVVYPLYPNPLK